MKRTRKGRYHIDCPKCGAWLEHKLKDKHEREVTLTCPLPCNHIWSGDIRDFIGGVRWAGRHFKRLLERSKQ